MKFIKKKSRKWVTFMSHFCQNTALILIMTTFIRQNCQKIIKKWSFYPKWVHYSSKSGHFIGFFMFFINNLVHFQEPLGL